MNRRLLAGVLLGCSLGGTVAAAYSPQGYPGSTWGTLSRDFDGLEGNGAQGFVKQGVQWLTLPYDVPFQTYGFFAWRQRSLNRPFYNELGPGAGFSLSKSIFDFGLDFYSQRFPELHETSNTAELYLSWYQNWDWLRGKGARVFGLPIIGVPLTTWGRFFDDFDSLQGYGAQGWISQGIDWYRFPGGVVLDTQGTYYFRYRSENRPFYDTQGPSLGVSLNWQFLTAGWEYRWSDYPELHQNAKENRVYLTWYYNWDLKKL